MPSKLLALISGMPSELSALYIVDGTILIPNSLAKAHNSFILMFNNARAALICFPVIISFMKYSC